MAGLKDKLEAAGYDTSSMDEASLLASLEKAGYDTSALSGSANQAPAESKAKQYTRKVANALPAIGAIGVPGIAAATTEGLSLPASAGLAAVGGAGGTAAKQLILRALGDTKGVPQTSTEAAKDIGIEGAKDAAITYLGGKAIQGAGSAVKGIGKLLFAPGAEEVGQVGKEALADLATSAQGKLTDIAEKGAQKLGMARDLANDAKEALIGAEEKAGLHFQSTPDFESYISDPKKLSDFSMKASRLAKLGPEQLAQEVDPSTLQTFRKIAQEGEKITGLSDIAKAQLREAKGVFTDALGNAEPEIGEQLGRLREANQVTKDIPGELKDQLVKQKLKNAQDLTNQKLTNSQNVLDAKSLENKRKLIKGALGAGATYLGIKKIFGGGK